MKICFLWFYNEKQGLISCKNNYEHMIIGTAMMIVITIINIMYN